MYRPAARTLLRSAAQSSLAPARTHAGRRFASTTPADGRRSWKSSALRWGIAVAGIYYYNTSPVFAEQPQHNLLNPNLESLEDSEDQQLSLESLTSRRAREAEKNKNAAALHSAADVLSSENASTTVVGEHEAPLSTGELDGAAGLEEEAGQQGAFNPETGEINWDCPCLGGMADGPCGPEFKEAFSCFVFSNEEPKGMDCIDKFQNMQQCFQRHPEVYKGELEDEELDAELEGERQELVKEIAERKAQQEQREASADGIGQRRLLEEPAPAVAQPAAKSTKKSKEKEKKESHGAKQAAAPEAQTATTAPSELLSDNEVAHDAPSATLKKAAPSSQPAADESVISEGDLVPKAAHDAREQVGVPEHKAEN
ncbi:uncharacterized protein A1O9_05344 [Exophiala aquamarina CBS 119918]|uniref:Mitochondrial intermembrane space import and assembly protein 40 n=1 Tax=Exophiala aquamarina CBS 119918 TaxID=1182545 RepID=A0A072PCD6_9EURO|nr:uncharacterized protein A1O9_05344 [Exophiala aquamarina CBS 119918]KEF57427.1 hypothetical protein A1O9_05344 [Exophiala aquamarina CBS 119918]